MTESSGIQVVRTGDEDGGATGLEAHADRPRRWVGWVVAAIAGGVLLALGGGGDTTEPPSTTPLASLVVEPPPEVEDVPVPISRGGLVGPALEFEEVARVPGLERVVQSRTGLLGIRTGSGAKPSIVRSTDGVEWTDLPELPDRVRPLDLVEWSGAPLILGVDVDPRFPVDALEPLGEAGLWELMGDVWESRPLATHQEFSRISWRPSELATIGDSIVVVGHWQPDLLFRIAQALPPALAHLVTSQAFWVEYHELPPEVSVAFLGTPVWSATPVELGLDPAMLVEPDEGYGTTVLVSDDLVHWESRDLSNVFIHRLEDAGSDKLGAQVWGQSQDFWVTTDGIQWVSESDIPGAVQLVHWLGDRPVAAMGRVIARPDGEAWRPISPSAAIPRNSTRDWRFVFMDVFDGRLVTGAQGTLWNEGTEPPPVGLESLDGRLVEVDLFGGTITTVDEPRRTWTLWSGRTGLMELDPDGGTLDLLADGQTAASLVIDDLTALEFPYPSLDLEYRVLVTSDERRWHMGTFSTAGVAHFNEPAVFGVGGRLLVVVGGVSDSSSGDLGVASVWAAALP